MMARKTKFLKKKKKKKAISIGGRQQVDDSAVWCARTQEFWLASTLFLHFMRNRII
jgi:hypothetical protein